MADYRLSANIISRKAGQSSVASAAYRSGSRLMDERTGEAHDFTRKGGVLHSEILTPANTPDWMRDRAQLWNAVEAVERRGDAQLSREIQLSLPHELTDEQRRELVRTFVERQFVDQGMIADIAIHAPGKIGDERNHHAHVMLTTRELTGEGFGKKIRTTMEEKKSQLGKEREAWASFQNRALERHGHEGRVDHRSYADQGVDREPTHHLGPTAHKMEANGRRSRIGNDNRAVDERNRLRVQWYVAEFKLERHIDRRRRQLDDWTARKSAELEAAQGLTRMDRDRKRDVEKAKLQHQLDAQYRDAERALKKEADQLERDLEAKGLRAALRNLTGRTAQDKTALANVRKSFESIQQRRQEQAGALEARHHEARKREAVEQAQQKGKLTGRFDRLKEQRKESRYLGNERAGPDAPNFSKAVKVPPSAERKTLEERPNLTPTYVRAQDRKALPPERPAHEFKRDAPTPAPGGWRGRPIKPTPTREQEGEAGRADDQTPHRKAEPPREQETPANDRKASQRSPDAGKSWWKLDRPNDNDRKPDEDAGRSWWKSARSDQKAPEPDRDAKPERGPDLKPGRGCDGGGRSR